MINIVDAVNADRTTIVSEKEREREREKVNSERGLN